MEKYQASGDMLFYFADNKIHTCTTSIEEYIERYRRYPDNEELLISIEEYIKQSYLIEINDIIPGIDFITDINDGAIMDIDGTLSNIFVDGYISNLGIIASNFCQGNFLVDDKTFLDICSHHKVEVNWANK